MMQFGANMMYYLLIVLVCVVFVEFLILMTLLIDLTRIINLLIDIRDKLARAQQ